VSTIGRFDLCSILGRASNLRPPSQSWNRYNIVEVNFRRTVLVVVVVVKTSIILKRSSNGSSRCHSQIHSESKSQHRSKFPAGAAAFDDLRRRARAHLRAVTSQEQPRHNSNNIVRACTPLLEGVAVAAVVDVAELTLTVGKYTDLRTD